MGSVALSIAGRDKGRYFVIIEVLDEGYVKVADGSLRKVESAKKKKLKHLKLKPVTIPTVKERLLEGGKLFDFEIRKHLEALGYDGRDKKA
ncbi:MAG: RNA-binding protein [Clostridiales bacterium]|nr:RNA-binding protein [Clostridiales bacterium]